MKRPIFSVLVAVFSFLLLHTAQAQNYRSLGTKPKCPALAIPTAKPAQPGGNLSIGPLFGNGMAGPISLQGFGGQFGFAGGSIQQLGQFGFGGTPTVQLGRGGPGNSSGQFGVLGSPVNPLGQFGNTGNNMGVPMNGMGQFGQGPILPGGQLPRFPQNPR